MASSSSVSDHPEEESIISHTFSRGYTYEVITEFLAKCHGITTCVRTLKNTGCRLKYLNFKEKIAIYFDMDVVQEQTMNELSCPGSPIRGCNYGWSRKNYVANSHKVGQPSRNYCQFLLKLCRRVRRLSSETED